VALDRENRSYEYEHFDYVEHLPGADLLLTTADKLLHWGAASSLWMFPMATSCCGIEFMAVMASRIDVDRLGTIIRSTPRQCDVLVMAGTVTVKMAPRIKKLWDQMPEPKWAIAMGSCAISGDFYRDIYSVVPGVDTILPVDVYVPGCPPGPEGLIDGLRALQTKILKERETGEKLPPVRIETEKMIRPAVRRIGDPDRDPRIDEEQLAAAMEIDPGGALRRVRLPQAPDAPPAPAAAAAPNLALDGVAAGKEDA
jgi:NADH-quinone oxidoreductase subunit B